MCQRSFICATKVEIEPIRASLDVLCLSVVDSRSLI